MSVVEDIKNILGFNKNVKGTSDLTDTSYENANWDTRPVQSDIKFTLSEYSQPTADIDPRQLKNFAYSSDVIKTIINSLRQEVFRKGIVVVKNYECKCVDCKAEYKKVEKICPNCGGDCYEPPISQKQRLQKIIKRANEQQELTDVLEMIEEDADIFDNTYFVLEKEYVIKNKEIVSVKSVKFFRGDPIVLRKLVSPSGRLGYIGTKKVYTCPLHRGYKSFDVEGENQFCPTCGTKLYRATFAQVKAGAGVVTRDVIAYYIEGEVIHKTKFTKTLGYGISPMVTLFRKVNCLIQQDDYLMRAYSEKKSPKGLLVVKTPNIDSFRISWEQASQNAQMNPNMVQALALESAGGDVTGKAAEYIDFMKALPDLSFTEQRDEFKKAIGAFYGVAPLFLNDSVLGDVPVYIRKYGKYIDIVPIRSLHKKDSIIYDKGFGDLEILSGKGWTKILHSYRHKVNKKGYDIVTGSGRTKVTEDHSIMKDGIETKPTELNIGDKVDWNAPEHLNNNEEISEKEAWLLGFYCAEGSTSFTRNQTSIAQYYDEECLDNVKSILDEMFCINTTKYKNGVRTNDKRVCDYFKENCYYYEERRSGFLHKNKTFFRTKKVPIRILNSNVVIKKAFIEGYYYGDGCVHPAGHIQSDSIDMTLSAGINYLLNCIGKDIGVSTRKDKPKVTTIRERKKSNLKQNKFIPNNQVKKITEFEIDDFVYDLETENHTFVAGIGYIVHHNTSASGGMNNERLQIVVSNRAIQMAQKLHNSILNDLCDQLGIDGWKMELAPSEDRDEVNELLIEKQTLEVQMLYKQLGFTAELNEEGEWMHKEDPFAGPLGSQINDPNNATGMAGGGSPPKYSPNMSTQDTTPQKFSGEPFFSKSIKKTKKDK